MFHSHGRRGLKATKIPKPSSVLQSGNRQAWFCLSVRLVLPQCSRVKARWVSRHSSRLPVLQRGGWRALWAGAGVPGGGSSGDTLRQGVQSPCRDGNTAAAKRAHQAAGAFFTILQRRRHHTFGCNYFLMEKTNNVLHKYQLVITSQLSK